MAFPTTGGAAKYSGTFIPEIWSGKLLEKFYDGTCLSKISNTDYEGEIKNHGDKIYIRTRPDIKISDYVKGQVLETQQPESENVELLIDKGKYFQVMAERVDQVQSDVKLLDIWAEDASEKMKISIDRDVLSGILPDVDAKNKGATAGAKSASYNLGSAASPLSLTIDNVVDFIVDMGSVLDEQNVPTSGRYLIIPTKMNNLIKRSELKDASLSGDGTSILRNGRIGMIDNFEIYVSHNLHTVTAGSDTKFYPVAGHKAGLTFASQFTEMRYLDSTQFFGKLMDGLQIFGYKVVKGDCLTHGVVTFS